MDFMPDNQDVVKVDEIPAGLPELPDEDTVLEEEITSVVIDGLVSQSPASNESLPTQNPNSNLVHFSDGTMTQAELNMTTMLGNQEGASSEEQQVALPNNLVEVYRNLGVLGKILTGGSLATIRLLQAFGTIGESVIDFLGITRPKYEYEINVAREMQEQEQARNDKIGNMYSTWQSGSQDPQPSTSGITVVPTIPPLNPPPVPQPVPGPQTGLSSMSSLSAALPMPSDQSIYTPSTLASVPLSSPPYMAPTFTPSSTPYPTVPTTFVPAPLPSPVYQPAVQQVPQVPQQTYAESFVPPLPAAAVASQPEVALPPQSALLTTHSFTNIPDTPTETVSSAPLAPPTDAVASAPVPVEVTSTLGQNESNPATNQTQSHGTSQSHDDVDPK